MESPLFVRLSLLVLFVGARGGPLVFAAAYEYPVPDPYRPLTGAKLQVAEEDCGPTFAVRFRARALRSEGVAVLQFNRQVDGDAYELRFSPTDVRLRKIAAGLVFDVAPAAPLRLGRPPSSLVLKRTPREVILTADGRLVVQAFAADLSGGGVGFACRGLELSDLHVQPTEALFFSDDFMKPAGERGEWQPVRGTWEINSLQNPVLSINAFSLLGKAAGAPALCTAGNWFWGDYHYEASVQGPARGAVGLACCVRDDRNYYVFRWEPMGDALPRGRRQLVRVRNGKTVVLAESRGGYLPGHWYRLALTLREGTLAAQIDGNNVLTATDPGLTLGPVGLYTESPDTTFFDDVTVVEVTAYTDDFRRMTAGAWTWLGGSWRLGRNGGLQATHPHRALAICQALDCSDLDCSITLRQPPPKQAGLVFHYQDPRNYCALVLDASKPSLFFLRMLDGKQTLLGATPLLPLRKRPYRLRVRSRGDHLTGFLDGLALVEGWDAELGTGRTGLLVDSRSPVVFSSFAGKSLDSRSREPVYTVHEVFSKEKSMEDWAAAGSDWITGDVSRAAGHPAEPVVHWHRADFYGDVEVAVDLGDLAAAGAQVRLLTNAEDQDPRSGYALVLERQGALHLRLLRAGRKLIEKTLPADADPAQLSLRRAGRFVVGSVDGAPVLHYADPAPLPGISVGYSAAGTDLNPENVKVYATQVYTYTFRKAPCEWRTAGGTWAVTNRWQCDPRWTFFSGVSDGLAVIWNKREFRGDVTLEFCGATKMNRSKERHAYRYDYAADIDAALCADGRDLTSGYNFLFGGWHNKFTRLTRGNEVLAESTDAVIPSRKTNIHHLWFYLKIQKRGDRIRCWLDNKLLFDKRDPAPLTGRRVALWTWNNGVMVARVRISASDGSRMELLDRPPNRKVKCIYDKP